MKSTLFSIICISGAVLTSSYSCKPSPSRPDQTSGEMNDPKVLPDDSVTYYTELGQKFVTATQTVLAKNLIGAIQKDGPEYALEFCNVQAYPLTDSVALAMHVGIKRVTDKTRNPGNRANSSEMAHLARMQSNLARGESPEPKVTEQHRQIIGYFPIITNAMCLQCHGKPVTDITQATMNKINTLYPDDQATGYDVNALRGLWVVEMERR